MRIKLALLIFVLFLLLSPSNVLAQTATPTPTTSIADVTPTPTKTRPNLKDKATTKITQAAERREAKLDAARLRVCRARAKGIGNRVKNIVERGNRNLNRHEKMVTRVDKFYNEKLVPDGYTLPNYDELKTDIEAKKTTVLTLIDEAKASGEAFSCESDDPKGQVDAFRADVKEVMDALKEYRISIKNFVTAVKDLAQQRREASKSSEEVAE